MYMQAFSEALGLLFTWQVLISLAIGTVGGLVGGALPGTGLAGLFVLIGFAYTLDPLVAIPMAIGFIVPVATTDAIPAVILGVPGSASTQAVIMDGYPLARRGEAAWALASTYWSSIFGGMVGVLTLLLAIPFARSIINLMGSPELLVIGLLGIGIVGLVSSGDSLRGLIAGALGMLVAMVGSDPIIGSTRLELGTIYLLGGIGIIPFTLGLFALPELATLVGRGRSIAETGAAAGVEFRSGRSEVFRALRTVIENRWLVARSAAVGALIGVMPGVGLSVIDWLTYGLAKSTVKDPEMFGKGDIRGIIAPSSADNATLSAALVPTLALAIPGGLTMAIFLGFMTIVGIQPGPTMLTDNLSLIYLIILCVFIANTFAGGTALLLSSQIANLTRLRPATLFPPVMAILTLAAIQASFSSYDLLVFLAFGILGGVMVKTGWPRVPMIIGFVLAPIIERYYWLTVQAYGWSFMRRPAVIIIVIIGFGTAILLMRVTAKAKSFAGGSTGATEDSPLGPSENSERE